MTLENLENLFPNRKRTAGQYEGRMKGIRMEGVVEERYASESRAQTLVGKRAIGSQMIGGFVKYVELMWMGVKGKGNHFIHIDLAIRS